MGVKIVTDSSASIPDEICQELDIGVVPVPIHFGNKTHLDGIDSKVAFYQQLAHSPVVPTTSSPSPGTFLEIYQKAAEESDAVIAIHMMESLSTLVNVAQMVTEMLPEKRIHVVDSQNITLGQALLVIQAARAAKRGATASEILSWIQSVAPQVELYAAIPQLDQLRRSGRVSLTQALMGGILSVKPIVHVGQGMVEVVDKARGWSRAVERVIDLAMEQARGVSVALALGHTNAEAEVRKLMERIRDQFQLEPVLVADAGTAIACHAGPGAIGIATMPLG